MDLDQELLVCEAVLARLNAAMASAEAEARLAGALEGQLRRLLDTLELQGTMLERSPPLRSSPIGPGGRSEAALRRAAERREPVLLMGAVQGRLHRLLRLPDGAFAQHL